MAGWILQYSQPSGTVDIGISTRNVNGSPLVSAEIIDARDSGSNVTPCGAFRFTFLSSTTLSIETISPYDVKNPALFSGARTVISDGVTENLNILPGVAVVLSTSAVEADSFEIGLGCYWDSSQSTWIRGLPIDVAFSGIVGETRSIIATNDTDSVQCVCQAVATNTIRIENTESSIRPLLAFRQAGLTNPVADTDLLGKSITFQNLVEGTPNTVSMLVAGLGIDVYDVTNDTPISGGVGLNCDDTTVYRFDDSTDYCSGEFILSSDLEVTDSAIIYVSDGGDFVELSDTVNGFVTGSSGIYLTEDSAPEGVVSDGEGITFQIRLNAPEDKTSEMNQRLFSLRISSVGI
jgi:hypothetical protein